MKKDGLPVYLITEGVLKTPRILHAFQTVDRRDFVPLPLRQQAYEDTALPIGHGQTISQPYTVAFMLEMLQPKRGHHVLDVGSGSGWTTALLSDIVGRDGVVVGLELVPELVAYGQENVRKYDLPQATIMPSRRFSDIPGTYDRILVSAAGDHVPQELIDKLRPDGVLVMPVGSSIVRVHRQPDSSLAMEQHEGFVFVPLRY